MGFRLTRSADADLVQIYRDGVDLFGPAQADRYLDDLWQCFETIADHPFAAPERMELSPPIRVRPYRSHIILYTVDGKEVLIVRVRHGREDWT